MSRKATSRSPHKGLPAAIFLLLAAALTGVVSWPQPSAAATRECTTAAIRPAAISARFLLLSGGPEHEQFTFPTAIFRYQVPALPEACRATYEQKLDVRLRYQTTTTPFSDFRSYQIHGTHAVLSSWLNLYRGASGTSIAGEEPPSTGSRLIAECKGNGLPGNLGRVRAVRGLARYRLIGAGTGTVVAQRVRPFTVHFRPSRRNPGRLGTGSCSGGLL